MGARIGWLALAAVMLCIPALAQPDAWEGTWRGELGDLQGGSTLLTLTLVSDDDTTTGVITGFTPSTEIRLTRVVADNDQITIEGATDSAFGPLSFAYHLTRDGQELGGDGDLTLGDHTFDVSLQLTRQRRADVPQPQVEPNINYFTGRWQFEYTGGEFPPLSIGTRSGTVTFTPIATTSFARAEVTGNVFGEAYEEIWTIGVNATDRTVVWREQHSDGNTLLSLGNWTSPIAITFLTAPVKVDGMVYLLRRRLQMTSETAFRVTDEFSVDGGRYRRLGNGSYVRIQ